MLATLPALLLLTVKHDNKRSSQRHCSMTTAADNVNIIIFFFLFPSMVSCYLLYNVVAVKRQRHN